MSLYNELKRRNVFRVAIAYLAGAWLLIEVAGTLFPAFDIPAWAFRFVVIVFALGFVPALIISWAYELTPDGLKREKDVVREASITYRTARRLDGITIGLVVVALAFILTDRLWLGPRLSEQLVAPAANVPDNSLTSGPESSVLQFPPNSIAVLPFVNMSDDAANEYFSDGISEELLNLLAKIPELHVISRSSAFSFKDKDLDIPTIAAQLNVAYVLEGSVRKAGNQVRITAQLIEVRSDYHLWSETYDRELENIFKLQDEISAAIVGALKERLGLQVETVPRVTATVSTEAHDAFLRGRHLLVQRTQASMAGAVREFEKAIAYDPDYVLAHAELAIASLLSCRHSYGTLFDAEANTRAARHVELAMALDSGLAETHAATGFLLWRQWHLEESLAHFKQAIQINPNYSIVYTWMGMLLSDQFGSYAEGFAAFEIALRLDPLSIPTIRNYVVALLERNRRNDAHRELEKITSIYPGMYANFLGELTSVGGEWANMALGSLDAMAVDPGYVLNWELAIELAVIGLEQEARSFSENIDPSVLQLLGKPKGAVAAMEARLAEDPAWMWLRIRRGPILAAAGDYARARPILEEMWQRSGGRVTRQGMFRISGAAALIAIYRDAGEEVGVSELLAAIRDNVHRYHEAGITGTPWDINADFEEGLADYLEGKRERGLVLIAKAAEDGYYILPGLAYLQILYDDLGFAPILEKQVARRALERKKLLDVVCTDNPYEAVWQPAEETCEQFAAATETDAMQ